MNPSPNQSVALYTESYFMEESLDSIFYHPVLPAILRNHFVEQLNKLSSLIIIQIIITMIIKLPHLGQNMEDHNENIKQQIWDQLHYWKSHCYLMEKKCLPFLTIQIKIWPCLRFIGIHKKYLPSSIPIITMHHRRRRRLEDHLLWNLQLLTANKCSFKYL